MAILTRCLMVFGALLLAAACDQVPPTPTPTRALSGPTLEASPIVLPLIPTVPPLDVGQSDLTAASLPRGAELPPLEQGTRIPGAISQSIVITLASGAQHPGELYPPSAGGIHPGVLLLGSTVSGWGDLPALLRDAGMTALVTDVPAGATTGDFNSLLTSLGETSDPGHLAVVGLGLGADAALVGCAAAQRCDAAVLIRPGSDLLINAMPTYNPRPLLIAVRQDDADEGALAQSLLDAADGDAALLPFAGDMPDSTRMAEIITWLISQLA
ncbi:MAG: hypothetical protein IPK19_12675 [Chloroflexi bacterium]|nr:hypothetical protein [Chloroflexota bacterium]